MRGIHNGRVWYDHTKACVTHASLQTSDMNGGVRFREKYQKPVYDECKYEGHIPQGWGNLDAKTMTQRFWLGTMSGCYVGHGETYKHQEDILWWAKSGVLHGESPKRIQWLKEFMKSAPTFHELKPLGDDKGRFLLAKPGEYYLAYCLNTRPQTVELAGNRPYKVDTIDPWAMTVTPAGTARPGAFTVNPPKADTVFRFTPCCRLSSPIAWQDCCAKRATTRRKSDRCWPDPGCVSTSFPSGSPPSARSWNCPKRPAWPRPTSGSATY